MSQTETTTWRKALDRAADLLMDHGIIRTGLELEQVCEQIRNLKLPVAGPKKLAISVEISAIELRELMRVFGGNANEAVMRYLNFKGIPAIHIDKVSRQFDVARGRIQYLHDLNKNVHCFYWEELVEEVPF